MKVFINDAMLQSTEEDDFKIVYSWTYLWKWFRESRNKIGHEDDQSDDHLKLLDRKHFEVWEFNLGFWILFSTEFWGDEELEWLSHPNRKDFIPVEII